MKPFGCRAMLGWALMLSLWLGAPSKALAETGSPIAVLSMGEAVAEALQHNPQVQASRYQVEAAIAQVAQARSGLLPQLEASETFTRTTSPLLAFGTRLNQGVVTTADFAPDRLNNPDPINNFRTALTLAWGLGDAQSWIAWQQSRRSEQAGQLALRRSEQDVIAQTAVAYAASLLADENLGVVEQALRTAEAHLKVVETRVGSGLAVRSDLLRAQVRIADLTQQRLEAQSQVRVALAMLAATMGRSDLITPATRLEPLPQTGQPPQGELEAWITRALETRPDLAQMGLQEEIARKEVTRARAAHLPTLGLQGEYEINSESFDDSKDNYSVGAVVKINLFSGQRISAQAAAAKAAASRIKAMRHGVELNVRVETQKAYYRAQSAWQSIQVAQTAVQQAQEALRIVANRYENGLLSLVSLLDAQVALQQAQARHYQAQHDYEVARVGLSLASGTIDKDFH